MVVAVSTSVSINCMLAYLSQLWTILAERELDLQQTASIYSLLGVVEMAEMPVLDRLPLGCLTTTPRRIIFGCSTFGCSACLVLPPPFSAWLSLPPPSPSLVAG
jgi:hypothetical protein